MSSPDDEVVDAHASDGFGERVEPELAVGHRLRVSAGNAGLPAHYALHPQQARDLGVPILFTYEAEFEPGLWTVRTTTAIPRQGGIVDVVTCERGTRRVRAEQGRSGREGGPGGGHQ